ncbi:type II toxin-antitoxin system HipA family toxin [Pseudoclavibacter sp. RFBB5]|uniref:type II toxin-antitoxin system HipA family toxin n=1 Tax=Pseudoclavibacter sp. RFBB5 TaxID=2080574 RepID=UPI000CE7E270|nr:type II toxin-antitoxin system HipA family toxin [Pseudoclavibacter sp. RFBB5]PPG29491.1 hypothetical protein C5B97_10910 [Pseudoclavibacter sp. RFBB5]
MNVDVFTTLADGREVLAGIAQSTAHPHRRAAGISFTYAPDYLRLRGAYALSPDLPLRVGVQNPPTHRPMFTGFADAMPDRWGTRLLQSEHRRRRRADPALPSKLDETGLLLAVPDHTRQGALRFRDGSGSFQSHAAGPPPAVHDLASLVAASDDAQRGIGPSDETLRTLVPIGTSQGGARPKAAVINGRGRLAIAKLPQADDRWNIAAWEIATMRMAHAAGIVTPHHELHPATTGDGYGVAVIERFDRDGDTRRGYLSLHSFLQTEDGQHTDYESIAIELTAATATNGEQLFRRVALTILVNNVDDHLRNHGLLLGRRGWELSPVFDVNPFPYAQDAATALTLDDDPDNRDLRQLIASADAYRLTDEQAIDAIREVEHATADWAKYGAEAGFPRDEIEGFADAFEGPNRERAKAAVPSSPSIIDLPAPPGSSGAAGAGRVWIPAHTRRGKHVRGHWRDTS